MLHMQLIGVDWLKVNINWFVPCQELFASRVSDLPQAVPGRGALAVQYSIFTACQDRERNNEKLTETAVFATCMRNGAPHALKR